MRKLRGKAVLCIGSDFLNLNLRCALLKEQGWKVFSSGSAHQGIARFGKERAHAVVLDFDDDGSEAALVAAELKRQRPKVRVVMLVPDGKTLAPEATAQADAVLPKSEEAKSLHKILLSLVEN